MHTALGSHRATISGPTRLVQSVPSPFCEGTSPKQSLPIHSSEALVSSLSSSPQAVCLTCRPHLPYPLPISSRIGPLQPTRCIAAGVGRLLAELELGWFPVLAKGTPAELGKHIASLNGYCIEGLIHGRYGDESRTWYKVQTTSPPPHHIGQISVCMAISMD